MMSIAQEHLIPQVEQAMKTVLDQTATRLERSTGLIKRQGKVTGANLAQTLVFGWMKDPNATIDTLAQQAAEVGLSISGPGLHERFTPDAVTFFQELFAVALTQVVVADPVAIPLFRHFSSVLLEDSSSIQLPAELADRFQGCGGTGSSAACKVFVRLDMLCGQLTCSALHDGKYADTRSPLHTVQAPARTLHIRDRGFTDVSLWQQEAEQDHYELSYLKSSIRLFDEQGQPLDLDDVLPHAGPSGEMKVLVGTTNHLPMRLLFERVPDDVAKERQRRMREDSAKRGQTLSDRALRLAHWSIAVTNVPGELLRREEALILLRLRWQIELLFKLWKDQGSLDEWRTKKKERILCELYAKLIGLLLLHWLLIISCWKDPHRSLVKAAQVVRGQMALLTAAIQGYLDLSSALARIQQVAQGRLNTRRDAPTTSQMLLSGHNRYANQPVKKRTRKR